MEEELKDALRDSMRQRMKKSLQSLEGETELGNIRPLRVRRWSMAAAIALLLAAGAWYLLAPGGDDPAVLAQAAFSPLPNILAPPVRGEDRDGILSQALRFYDDARYTEAVQAFEALPDSLHSESSFLYLATAYVASSKPAEAIDLLNKLDPTPATKWYLCLAYLQQGQLEEAKRLATALARNGQEPFYQERAAELLRHIQ